MGGWIEWDTAVESWSEWDIIVEAWSEWYEVSGEMTYLAAWASPSCARARRDGAPDGIYTGGSPVGWSVGWATQEKNPGCIYRRAKGAGAGAHWRTGGMIPFVFSVSVSIVRWGHTVAASRAFFSPSFVVRGNSARLGDGPGWWEGKSRAPRGDTDTHWGNELCGASGRGSESCSGVGPRRHRLPYTPRNQLSEPRDQLPTETPQSRFQSSCRRHCR